MVVGASAEQMRAAGYKQVGRDFPVFLHPRTGEEYALARTERKSARGHAGFVVHADPSVTLEQDLGRRDFTINAIARRDDGTLVDPFGGARDIDARVLRHVGEAFVEDPLRVLRAARFMARLAPLGFVIAPETLALMRDGRGWRTRRTRPNGSGRNWRRPCAVRRRRRSCAPCAKPMRWPRCCRKSMRSYGVPQRAEYHPEIDTGTHVELACDMAATLAPGDDLVGFATLAHDLGKALTPAGELPRHVQHEQRGIAPLLALCERLRVPNEHRELAAIACREHLNVHRIDELKPATVHDLIARCDGFRKPARIAQLAIVCEADARGRAGLAEAAYPQARTLRRLHAAALSVRSADVPPDSKAPPSARPCARRGSRRSPPRAGSDRLFGGGGIDAGEDAIHRVRGGSRPGARVRARWPRPARCIRNTPCRR